MDKSLYELIAYIARYWFALLMFVILWRAVHWLRFNANRNALVKSMLPDAGFIGEWVVLHGGDQLRNGAQVQHNAQPHDDSQLENSASQGYAVTLSATRDGWIGSGRTCDVRIHAKGIPKRVARFYLRPDGLHLLPQKAGLIEVDGAQVLQEAIMRHGATLSVRDITIQLRLFAGILLAGETPLQQQPQRTESQKRMEPPQRMELHAMDDTEAYGMETYGTEAGDTEADGSIRLPQPSLKVSIRRNRGRKSGQRTPNPYS